MIFSAVFVILPLLLIVVYAFMDDAGHFTLGNFAKFFAHPEAINTFVYSIGVAIITTVVCILLIIYAVPMWLYVIWTPVVM